MPNSRKRQTTMEDSETRKMFEEILKEIKEMKSQHEKTQEETKKDIKELKNEIQILKQDLLTKTIELDRTLYLVEEKNRSELNGLEKRIQILEEKEEKRIKREKKNNVIIKTKEIESTNHAHIREATKKILKSIGASDSFSEAQYVGQDAAGKSIIRVQMPKFFDKIDILKKKSKLKGKDTFIESDLTKQERDIQAAIRKKAKEEREKGNTVKIGYQKLQINGQWENWALPREGENV